MRVAWCLPVLLAAGCKGEIVATAELHGAGTAEARFTPTPGKKQVLWADTDGTWRQTENMQVSYEIDVLSGGATVGHVSCNTDDSSYVGCGMITSTGSVHSGDCAMKLRCALPTLPAGEITLRVTATPSRKVDETKKDSLVVREK
jgi:hypothetical protein